MTRQMETPSILGPRNRPAEGMWDHMSDPTVAAGSSLKQVDGSANEDCSSIRRLLRESSYVYELSDVCRNSQLAVLVSNGKQKKRLQYSRAAPQCRP